jgi:NAD(P)-dependent dehydrogenase (short-subunit alcohol dehydrogenase family)
MTKQRGTDKKQIALVTGASSGIGQATAERLANAGYKVYGTSRRGAPAGQRPFEMLPLDVTNDDSVAAAVNEVIRREGRIDLLVNNAGFSLATAGAEESSIEQVQSIFNTNFFGIVRMTRAVLPFMRNQNSGRIINIGSIVGFLPAPFMAFYSATKHAVEGYSQSLDHEVRTWGIRVAVIEPAGTSTQIDANAIEADSQLEAYRQGREIVGKRLSAMIETGDSPRDVAEVVLKAATAARPSLRYTVGKEARKLRLISSFAPAGMVDSALRKQMGLNTLVKR